MRTETADLHEAIDRLGRENRALRERLQKLVPGAGMLRRLANAAVVTAPDWAADYGLTDELEGDVRTARALAAHIEEMQKGHNV